MTIVKNCIKSVIVVTARLISLSPKLRVFAVGQLRRFPGLKDRLSRIVIQAENNKAARVVNVQAVVEGKVSSSDAQIQPVRQVHIASSPLSQIQFDLELDK